MIQRAFIKRNKEIADEIKSVGIMQVLKGVGTLEIVGAAVPEFNQSGASYPQKLRSRLPELWHEASLANTYSLYLFLFVCLITEAIILFA